VDTEPRILAVTGEGIAHGTPDRCLLHLALSVMADTAADALDRVADLAALAVESIRELAIEPKDVQTTNLSLDDFYDQHQERVTARVASYSLTVRTSSLKDTGPVLAALSEVAGDSLQVKRLQLVVSDPEALQESARQHAVVDAAKRAHQIAEVAGVHLGPIQEITEGEPPRRGRPVRAMAFAASPVSSIPVEAGEVMSTVAVTVTYAIED
jgi:uncharacterized protein